MQVEYEDNKVKELFEDLMDVRHSRKLMQKKIGKELSVAVKKRYDQLKAYPNFSSLLSSPLGRAEPLKGRDKGSYSVRVTANFRLIIAPATEDFSVVGLKKCDLVIIKGVTDYHGSGANNNWIIP